MSLRTFHICFVTISILLMVYIGVWAYSMWDYYANEAYLSYLFMSVISLVALLIYGKSFITKYKNF